MSRCDPPRAAGQPTAWPEAANVSPNDEVSGDAEVEDGVGGQAREQAPGLLARRTSAGRASVAGHNAFSPKRVSVTGWRGGRSSGPEDRGGQVVPPVDEGADQPAPGPAVGEPRPSAVASIDRSSTAARPSGRGWAAGRLGVHPLQAVVGEGQPGEDGRRRAEGVDGGAHVVDEAGQGQLLRPAAAAGGRGRLQHHDRAAGPGQGDRRRQPVGPGAHHHRVDHVRRGATCVRAGGRKPALKASNTGCMRSQSASGVWKLRAKP